MNIDLDTAYLGGILLEMEEIEDGFAKSIARYEYPYADGADLEDMGQKARTVRMRAWFWDSETQSTYNDHIALVNLLADKGLLELIHPKYGIMEGMVDAVTVRHDDTARTAAVEISFVEQLRGAIEPVEFEDVFSAAESSWLAAQAEQMAAFADEVTTELGAESVEILAKELDPAQDILAQFTAVSLKARTYLKKVDTFVRGVEADLTEVANPANGLVSTINYGLNLPGRVIGSLARCVERYATLYRSTTTGPARFVDRMEQAQKQLIAAFGFEPHVHAATSSRTAYEAADLYRGDEENRQKLRRREQGKSFDTLGNRLSPAPALPVMTVGELEASLAAVRRMLQEALDQLRAMRSLTAMAESLLRHVNTVKLERERLVTVALDNAVPLHIVCLRYGLPYNYAERLATINQGVRNPTFTAGAVKIYVQGGGQ